MHIVSTLTQTFQALIFILICMGFVACLLGGVYVPCIFKLFFYYVVCDTFSFCFLFSLFCEPGHVGIGGNSAAEDALDSDISDELIPFSDLKPRLNKYILDLWQTEWDDYPHNKLYKTFSKLKECVTPRCSNRREETVLSRLHIGHSFFLVKRRGTTCMYSM